MTHGQVDWQDGLTKNGELLFMLIEPKNCPAGQEVKISTSLPKTLARTHIRNLFL